MKKIFSIFLLTFTLSHPAYGAKEVPNYEEDTETDRKIPKAQRKEIKPSGHYAANDNGAHPKNFSFGTLLTQGYNGVIVYALQASLVVLDYVISPIVLGFLHTIEYLLEALD